MRFVKLTSCIFHAFIEKGRRTLSLLCAFCLLCTCLMLFTSVGALAGAREAASFSSTYTNISVRFALEENRDIVMSYLKTEPQGELANALLIDLNVEKYGAVVIGWKGTRFTRWHALDPANRFFTSEEVESDAMICIRGVSSIEPSTKTMTLRGQTYEVVQEMMLSLPMFLKNLDFVDISADTRVVILPYNTFITQGFHTDVLRLDFFKPVPMSGNGFPQSKTVTGSFLLGSAAAETVAPLPTMEPYVSVVSQESSVEQQPVQLSADEWAQLVKDMEEEDIFSRQNIGNWDHQQPKTDVNEPSASDAASLHTTRLPWFGNAEVLLPPDVSQDASLTGTYERYRPVFISMCLLSLVNILFLLIHLLFRMKPRFQVYAFCGASRRTLTVSLLAVWGVSLLAVGAIAYGIYSLLLPIWISINIHFHLSASKALFLLLMTGLVPALALFMPAIKICSTNVRPHGGVA